jgi:hypothetical protein
MRPVGPYHEGELAVQERAGVSDMARRIGRMVRAEVPPVAADFLAQQRLIVMGWVDDGDGRVWASPLAGEPGFIAPDGSGLLAIGASLVPGDPLARRARPPAHVGLLAIDLATRRRMRINGAAIGERPDVFAVLPDQVYSNCPKYIQARELVPGAPSPAPGPATHGASLTGAQAALIARADTFFIATVHPQAGADASHRGGRPGFVQVADDGSSLSWPDYAGNAMFQTLGNIASDGRAGLLVIDFESGSILQLSGTAHIVWQPERRVELRIERTVEVPAGLPLRWRFVAASPFNP